MKVLITYDLKEDNTHASKHTLVKKCMKDKGYVDRFNHSGKIMFLPNTTLVKSNTSAVDARNHLQVCCATAGAVLERCIAVEFDDTAWAGIYGQEYAN